MNIALVLQHKLLLGLQYLVGEAKRPAQRQMPQPQPLATRYAGAPTRPLQTPFPNRPHPLHATSAPRQAAPSPMPLRVLRIVDKDLPCSSTGRMVISGRMADVCAELDRLAAREAALH